MSKISGFNIAGFCLLAIFVVFNANAATYTVSKVADTNDGVCDADCSLREAVSAANANSENDAIDFQAALFSTPQTILLGGSQIQIINNGSLIVTGSTGGIKISGNQSSRVFLIDYNANVTLQKLTISDGFLNSGFGAGIHNSGNLNLIGSLLRNNVNIGTGGGIANFGTLNAINSTISTNTGDTGGGIYSVGTVNLTNTTITKNVGYLGGGIENYSSGVLNSKNSLIAENTGIINSPDIKGQFNSLGYNLVGNTQNTVISGTTTGNILNVNPRLAALQNNDAKIQTHALLADSPAINGGNSALAVDQNNQPLTFDQRGFRRLVGTVDIGAFELNTQVLTVDTNSNSTLSACTAAANDCSLRGAVALVNSRIDTETISFDPSFFSVPRTIDLNSYEIVISKPGKLSIIGTAANLLTIRGSFDRIFTVNETATVIIENVTLTDSHIQYYDLAGGAILNEGNLKIINSTISNSSSIAGGGIYNTGTLTVLNSSIINNVSTFQGGGGIRSAGNADIINSTISGNSATSLGGGGLYVNSGVMNITNSTITNNSSHAGGGGIFTGFNTVNIGNSIVYGNSSDNSDNTQTPDFHGIITSKGNNILRTITNGYSTIHGVTTGNVINIDPLLNSLQFNGGQTMTHSFNIASRASNGGNNALAVDSENTTLTTDQRGAGFQRILETVDIGAFEGNVSVNLRVDSIGDSASLSACTDAPGDCSLRGAIIRANSLPDVKVISFDLFNGTTQVISPATEFAITGSGITYILGTGADTLTINGSNAHRIFTIASGASLSVSDVSLTDGKFIGAFGGGCIYNSGTFYLNDSGINSCESNGGGAIGNFGSAVITNSSITNNIGGAGGAIYNFSNNLTIINTTISGNSASSYGGAIYNGTGYVKLINSTVFGNQADEAGSIYQSSTGTVSAGNSIIAGNSAGYLTQNIRGNLISLGYNLIDNTTDAIISGVTTGNILHLNPKVGALKDNGGTILTNELLSDSPAINTGSNALALDADNQPLKFDQRGLGFGRAMNGNVDIGAFETAGKNIVTNTNNSGTGSLRQAFANANSSFGHDVITFAIPPTDPNCSNGVCSIALAYPDLGSGSIKNSGYLTIDNSSGMAQINISASIRFLNLGNGADVTLKNLNLTGAASIFNAGSALHISNLKFSNGANFFNTGTTDILDSEFNNAFISNNGNLNARNISIIGYSYSGLVNKGNATLTNATISGNRAETGAGIYNEGTVNVYNSTITNNIATYGGGGIYNYYGTVNVKNSILAGNIGTNYAPDISGTINSLGYNIIGDTNNTIINGITTGNKLNVNARLSPLGFYGGFSKTHALLSGSPAINAGNALNSPTTDQRGAARIGTTDIGAFELNNTANGGTFVAALPSGSQFYNYNFPLTTNSGTATYTVTSATLPNGLSLTTSLAPNATIAISGFPVNSGTFNFSITSTDGANSNVTNYTMFLLGPTAANVGVSGKVTTADGRGLQNAIVTMTDSSGIVRSTKTGSFGFFRFEDVEAGQSYIFQVVSKRYTFAPQFITINNEITELNLTAQNQ